MIATAKGILFLSSTAGLSVMLGSAADSALNENTPVSLGAVLACGGVVVSGAWWLSKKMSKQDQMHKENKKRFQILERNVNAIQRKLGVQPVFGSTDDDADTE